MPEYIVPEKHHQYRLDHVISELETDQSRSLIRKWIDEGLVKVNQQGISKAGHKLKAGDLIQWESAEIRPLEIKPENIPLDIVYEDSDLLVINKPVGMVVHPGAGHFSGTLVHALLHHCDDLSGIGGVERPGIVHRLDKETSGLLAVAKNDFTHQALQAQLQSREMKRHYYALVEYGFSDNNGTIEAAIDRHPVDRQKMAVIADGRFARTHWRVLETFDAYTWLALELDTGRTHQIRVHLKHIHRPLVGDSVYGSNRKHPFRVERPLLHAYQLVFHHPRSGEKITCLAELPADFQHILQVLRKKS